MLGVLLALSPASWEEAIRATAFAADLAGDEPVPALGGGWPLLAWSEHPQLETFALNADDPEHNRRLWDATCQELGHLPLIVIDPLALAAGESVLIPPEWLLEWPGPTAVMDWTGLWQEDLTIKLAASPPPTWPLGGAKRIAACPGASAESLLPWKSLDRLSRLQADPTRAEILASLGEPDAHLVVAAFSPSNVLRATQSQRGLHYRWVMDALSLYLDRTAPSCLVVAGLNHTQPAPRTHYVPLPTPAFFQDVVPAAELLLVDSPWHPALHFAAGAGIPAVVLGSSAGWQDGLVSQHPAPWGPIVDLLTEVAKVQPAAIFPHETFPQEHEVRPGVRDWPAPYYQADLLDCVDFGALLQHFLLDPETRQAWQTRSNDYLQLGDGALSARSIVEALA